MLFEHVLEILIGRDGDERVEVFVRQLVFQKERPVVVERAREVGRKGGEISRHATAVHGHDPGVAAGIAERLVVGPRHYVAAVATH